MKANEAPEKVYVHRTVHLGLLAVSEMNITGNDIEYTRTDAFIEKARKWFEMQNEGVGSDGNYVCDMTDFEGFKNYMKGE